MAAGGGAPGLTAVPVPACWASYEQSAVVATPPGSAVLLSPRFLRTLAFLHARRSPTGHERIVAVRCVPLYLSSVSVVQAFDWTVAERAAAWPLTSRPDFHGGHFSGGYPMQVPVQVFGGQSDPADLSHFTIAYTVGGQPGTLDGWLGDDETVKLQVRPGSADVMAIRKASMQ